MGKFSVVVVDQALAVGTAETVVQYHAGAGKSAQVSALAVSFNGVSADAPVTVRLLRQNDAGASTAFTPAKMDPNDNAALGEGRTAFTGEPAIGDMLAAWKVTPNSGLFLVEFDPVFHPLLIGADGRVGVQCTAAVAVSVTGYMWVVE